MTAEVAVLNKSAVVLAADSAVTISRGSSQEKTFDSADKLFELSNQDPIAVMINGDLDFMEAPLSVLIKQFREKCADGDTVEEVAEKFLSFLSTFGSESPKHISDSEIRRTVKSLYNLLVKRVGDIFQERLDNSEFFETLGSGAELREKINELRSSIYDKQIKVFQTWLRFIPNAEFIGGGLEIQASDEAIIREVVDEMIPSLAGGQVEELMALGREILAKTAFASSETGVVVAGYGRNEIFPTLVSYSVYGSLCGKLKFVRNEKIDIDRSGPRARVIAFAQREMVERFIYGIDDEIQRKISTFSKEGVSAIREAIFQHLEIEGDGLASLEEKTQEAEQAFLDGLASKGFDAIRRSSEAEIEGMVEFMPKIEMARMAEALVNLTSIKRRVSRGMETVGGPIDVAVISKSEGLVWVKRKHYFPTELNAGFFDRKRKRLYSEERHRHD